MRRNLPQVLAFFLLATNSAAQSPAVARIAANDNRTPAGALENGLLTVTLEVRNGRWYPEADNGASVEVQAFAEAGHAPSTPGPLIRVPEGTRVRATLRNKLALPARVLGLGTRPLVASDGIVIAPGRDTTITFEAGAPGTYYYWGTTKDHGLDDRGPEESQLSGAFIVDPKLPSQRLPDRVFVLGLWNEPASTVNGV
ncbi:MAG TPA: multicopper oxidase domain-containing protein, partial [Gemmatimonadaceae bacterium]|nr:multicopper oxidase domain-containing protein [Gemmatimonadaceae bacterium]